MSGYNFRKGQVKVEVKLDEEILFERRKNYHVAHRDDPRVGVNDDPRWTEARKAYWG